MWPNIQTTIALFLGICVFRVANTFLIQSFFDPDEYWQTLEPAYCEVFLKNLSEAASPLNLECAGYTWEWKRRAISSSNNSNWIQQCLEGPIRSYLSVLPTHLFYSFLAKFHWDTHFLVSQGPKILTAVIAAAPTDLAVWIMAHWLPTPLSNSISKRPQSAPLVKQSTIYNDSLPWFCLFCSMISWFHGYALVRTFSNSLETMLLTVSMALIAPELLGNNVNELSSISTAVRQSVCFLLGGCSVAMRFSSVTAWVPMGILLANQRYPQKRSWVPWFFFLIRTCAAFGALGIFLACAVDRYFYGFWTTPFLGSFHFNVILGNSLLYGSHAWHWYFTAGMPAVTGLWLPLVLWDFGLSLVRKDAMSGARRNLWIIIMTYTVAHSQSGHKEFRFLMPILPLLCLVASPHLQSVLDNCFRKRTSNQSEAPSKSKLMDFLPWLILLAIPNLIALLYLGLFHQSAPISVNHRIAEMISSKPLLTQQNQDDAAISSKTYAIHYLTGACHSTPLHSYLHIAGVPAIQFDTWSLDCSPDCRSNPDVLCESDQFAKDPVGFVEAAYFQNPTCVGEEDVDGNSEQSCSTSEEASKQPAQLRSPPHFLVTYADYAARLKPQLSGLGLQEMGRFPHGINGLRIGTRIKTGDGYALGSSLPEDTYRRIQVMGDILELSIDEMVLYASPSMILIE